MLLEKILIQTSSLFAVTICAAIFGPLSWGFLLGCALGWPLLDLILDAAIRAYKRRRDAA